MKTSDERSILIVDGSNFIFRAYHALPPLTTKNGTPTGAVYGFINMLIKLEADYRPSHLVVVFDASAHSFRNDIFADYKANRDETPDDLVPQFDMAVEIIQTLNIPVLQIANVEADDVIATLATTAKTANLPVRILSSDKDLMQLVDETCVLIDTMKTPSKIYDREAVQEKFGVPPELVGDILALMGDTSDNVPGIAGIGPKTAAQLIQAYGTLEKLLENPAAVAGNKTIRGAAGVARKLAENAEVARLSRKLVALQSDVPLKIELANLERKPYQPEPLHDLLRKLEFHRLIDRLSATSAQAVVPSTSNLPQVPWRAIETTSDLGQLASHLAASTHISFLPTFRQKNTLRPAVAGLAISLAPNRNDYHIKFGEISSQQVIKFIADSITATARKTCWDCKSAELLLPGGTNLFKSPLFDPKLAAYLLQPGLSSDLGPVTERVLNRSLGEADKIFDKGGDDSAAWCLLAGTCLELAGPLEQQITEQALNSLLFDMEIPLSHVLAEMERTGIRIDSSVLFALEKQVSQRLIEIETDVGKQAGVTVNLASPKQLQMLFFEKLGLPATKKTKTGYSVDAEVLEELAPLHPVANLVLEHRTLSKLLGTYITVLPSLVDSNGRLHTSYLQTTAATGRLSSVDPNLQNVPIRTETGKQIRRAFVTDPGMVLLVCDYSQIELRVLAHLSQDPVLIDAFARDQDIHERTVQEMFGPEAVHDANYRRVAKMINYGILYGLSDFGLATRLGIERAAASRYIKTYFATYQRVAKFIEQLVVDARAAGGAKTWFGRFRPLPDLQAKNHMIRTAAERMAKNTPIQGTAADLFKVAMIRVQAELEAAGSATRMLLTVHDELVFEVPEAESSRWSQQIRATMENVVSFDVPLKVDVGLGRSWAEAK